MYHYDAVRFHRCLEIVNTFELCHTARASPLVIEYVPEVHVKQVVAPVCVAQLQLLIVDKIHLSFSNLKSELGLDLNVNLHALMS